MNKKPLIGVSICAVVLLVLASLTNVVGYQAVQSSNQKTITEEINQKELLFQTIVDITNNKDIQKVILQSQISKGGFFNPDARFPILNTPVLTKNQLKQMYVVGLVLSKFISKQRMHLMVEKYQVNNQWMQKEITAVIEKNATLNREIKQLSSSGCGCDNTNTNKLNHPVICTTLLFIIGLMLMVLFAIVIILIAVPLSLFVRLYSFIVGPWEILYYQFGCSN